MSRSQSIDAVLLSAESMDAFVRSFMSSLVVATKSTKALADDASSSTSAAQLIRDIAHFAGSGLDGRVDLSDDLSDGYLFEQLSTVMDALLDSADSDLNEHRDGKSAQSRIREALSLDKDRILASNVADIPKPQLSFASDVCNARREPFRPRLTRKPFASAPLDLRLLASVDPEGEEEAVLPTTYYAHPYESELRGLRYPSWQTSPSDAEPTLPSFERRPFSYVDTSAALQSMLEELRGCREVAVDLEHHSFRSFQGITCVLQLSTREADYVVDALALRHELSALLDLFVDPGVVKVFHGCESDVLWLQKDLGLYVVNAFDSFHAAKLLKYPSLSLAHLVKFHCGVSLDKRYQMSDWRERPLGEARLQYARLDTAFLLPLYDVLRRELLAAHGEEGLMAALDATRHVCLKRYEVEPFYPLRYRRLLDVAQRRQRPSEAQETVVRALFDWRDATARAEDESVAYVMSNAELVRIGLAMPVSLAALGRCGPLSDSTRRHAEHILALVRDRLSGPSAAGRPKDKDKDKALFVPVFDANSGGSFSLSDRPAHTSEQQAVLSFVPSTPKRAGADAFPVSPVLHIDEIFRIAGWSTPGATETRESPPVQLDPVSSKVSLDALRADVHSSMTAGSLNRVPADRPSEAPATESEHKGPSKQRLVDDGYEPLLEVPKSFSEIYDISNRNRGRGKEKKRGRDGGAEASDVVMSSPSDATSSLAALESGYFKDSSIALDTSAEATVDLFAEVGWLSSADKSDMLEAHRSEHAGQEGMDGDETRLSRGSKNSPPRNAPKGAYSPPRNNSGSGNGGNGNGSKGHSPVRGDSAKAAYSPPRGGGTGGGNGGGNGGGSKDSPHRGAKAAGRGPLNPDVEPFDYSKFAGGGIGAWPAPGTSSRPASSQQAAAAYNPFLHGPQQGAKPKGKVDRPGGGAVGPDKKETERSFTFGARK